jgi:hypothetical protein|tara:strand:- start:2275 stop:2535 length:261 start_codon:yes stop_codon:yes gene_type:complete
MRDFGFGALEEDIFVTGDLVMFTGYLYTPDYVYADQFARDRAQLGVVLGAVTHGQFEDMLYRVHWLRTNRISEVVGAHLRLAYVRK